MNMAAIKTMVDNAQPPQQTAIDLLRGDQVKMEPVDWLWRGWLARSKLHILAGVAGTGKTTIALSLAAAVTSGGRWPDGSRAILGDVVIWSGEDDPADTLAPRLKAMGANMQRIHFVNGVNDGQGHRSFDPAKDIAALAQAIETIRPALLIVDPIVSAVAGDSHKNTETRRALQPLVDMAAKAGVALLGISHFSKGSAGRDPTERVTGSLAFAALARVVMAAAKVEEEQGGGRIFCRTKSNVGADDGGFRYDLAQREVDGHPDIVASCVVWGEAVEGSARVLLADAETSEGEGGSLQAAKEFLETELADGPVSAKQIKIAAEQAGHSFATVRRAKDALGIKPEKGGMKDGWRWALPSKMLKDTEDAQQNGVSTFAENEHLRTPLGQDWEVEL
ncbi:MAG: AAA family ATPase [Alphaproteobacteria bacterium]|nr:AAA family ATPase [Alphaproteobacteria bacterium]